MGNEREPSRSANENSDAPSANRGGNSQQDSRHRSQGANGLHLIEAINRPKYSPQLIFACFLVSIPVL